jgi:DNA modification methylase
MKPPRLIRVTLGNSTVRGDVVVDPFAGSGSTMVACEQMGRRAMMIEIEPRFADVILRRYRELTGDEPALVDPAKEA